MLSHQEREEIEAEVALLPYRSAGVIEALKVVQKHRRWVDDAAVGEIAELLGVSPTEVDSVATFYNLIFRRPVGRHVILLCDSVSCWLCGYAKVRETFAERLGIGFGQTTPDDRFTLLPVPCLGACDRAPVLMIDDDTHFDVDPARLETILEGYE